MLVLHNYESDELCLLRKGLARYLMGFNHWLGGLGTLLPFTFIPLFSASKTILAPSGWPPALFPPTCSPAIQTGPGPVRAERTHGIRPTGPLMATSWSFKTRAAEWRAIVQTVIWWPAPKHRQSQVSGDSPLPLSWGYRDFLSMERNR